MKLDIGCGPKCLPDFIGVDRFPLPGVSVVTDLNCPLPFQDDSVDIVHAAHSLEHVADIMFTMREIYRVCKHQAQICIVAPYYEQKLNLANPYHLQVFNEHTPRFWTHFPWAPISESEYYHPHAAPWGLSFSDHSNPQLDIRLLRMEFFHFPRFAGIDPDSLRELRQTATDVCHQIVYHLVVWKDKEDEDYIELTRHLDQYPFLSTPDIENAREPAAMQFAGDYVTQQDSRALQQETLRLTALAQSQDRAIAQLTELVSLQQAQLETSRKREDHSQEVLELLSGHPRLSGRHLKSLEDANTSLGRSYQFSKVVPGAGLYLEYPISGTGEFNTVLLVIYRASLDTQTTEVGVELVSKDNEIIWSGTQQCSGNRAIMAVELPCGNQMKKDAIVAMRVFSHPDASPIQVVEQTIYSGWLRRKIINSPLASLILNDHDY